MNKATVPPESILDVSGDSTICQQCGALAQLNHGTCINCLLLEGIDAPGESSRERFESILLEADVPDRKWRLGHYEILEEIGRGGMGVIYRARQQHSRRVVAVKRVFAHEVGSRETLLRFRREAEAVASLDHPNILPIYEVSENEEGLPFFSMKYATGGSLRVAASALRKDSRKCVRVMAKVSRAIAYAHGKGVIHRDLQPGNILLDENGQPMVSDFGLAKWLNETSDLTRTLETLGTPGYIAPEQTKSRPADLTSAADIYSLGAILFYLLTGRPPFVGPNVLHVIHQAAAAPAPRLRSLAPSLDRDLETIVGRCLESDPKARYQSAAALADDLEHWLRHEPIRARRIGPFARGGKWVRRNPTSTVLIASLIMLAAATAVILWDKRSPRPLPPGVAAMPSKSIAVLPFENLSADPESVSFTDGVHHEILNDLAKIADLKVIGPTSVKQHKAQPKRNLRQIANELGVTHIVEGSVQREANRVRVSARLTDARNGQSIWRQNYDRTLADSVSLEGDLAMQIATAVGATLNPQEKALVTKAPTNNATAYDAYLSARVFASEDQTESAVRSYQKAVELDPDFALAWAGLSSMQSLAHWELDSSPDRVSTAKAAIDHALALNPNLPEVHLALGYYRYYVMRDFTGALSELRQAEQAVPNDTDVIKTIAMVQRRLGQWDEALAGFLRGVELDPRDIDCYTNLAGTYEALRRFPDVLSTFNRALSWEPVKLDSEAAWKSVIKSNDAWKGLLLMKADTLWATDNLPTNKLPYESAYTIAFMRAGQALRKGGYPEAKDILTQALADKSIATYSADVFEDRAILLLMLGLTQQRAGDIADARATYQQVVQDARHTLETVSPGSSAETQARVNLASAYAGLGEADSAIEEARKAMAIIPSSKDAYRGPKYEENMARIYALLGDADHAVPILERLLHISYLAPLTPAKLRTDPTLDQIRSDPRFEVLAEEGKPIPEKTIAVLPFENLSGDQDNGYFAGGIQQEILTRLASIADLKVISRTSTQLYQSKPRTLREIAQQLGVRNIVEGSVQKAGDQVRINVQLINAQTDSHLWADTYDRKLTDIFGVESEIGKRIAESLQAKLTSREEQALSVKPTNNPEAYDAYLHGLALESRSAAANVSSDSSDLMSKTVGFYERAVQLDPNFALAWARLSRQEALRYFYRMDPNVDTVGHAAKYALENAERLEPNSPETLLALGYYQYRVLRDYGLAETTFERVEKMLPGGSEVRMALGAILAREGKWNQSVAYLDQALVLDPRNMEWLMFVAATYADLRQFPTALKLFDRILDITPNDLDVMAAKASIYQAEGKLEEADRFLSGINEQTPSEVTFNTKITQLRLEQNYGEAVRLLQARLAQFHFNSDYSKALCQISLAFTQRLGGDAAGAKVTVEQTLNALEELYRAQPDNEFFAASLSQAYAMVGEEDSALKAAKQAIALLPSAKDRRWGPMFEENLALIRTIVGEKSRAIETLTQLLNTPHDSNIYASLTPALLKLDPLWDPLRSDPAFQKLCEEK